MKNRCVYFCKTLKPYPLRVSDYWQHFIGQHTSSYHVAHSQSRPFDLE